MVCVYTVDCILVTFKVQGARFRIRPTWSNLEEGPAPSWPAGAKFEFWARSLRQYPSISLAEASRLEMMDGLLGGDEVRQDRDNMQWQRKTVLWREL
jgi:hypothetical protein